AGFAYGDKVHVVLKNKGETYYDDFVAYEKSFGFVEVGDAILFDSSSNVIELGINQGNFKETYHVCEGPDYGYALSK
ncbi:MAG: hypothetical protein K5682_04240, partial [Lachnospiraceae bacterium]|nr:hypothetical protein [Lachnospiraceae bacterium]